MSFLSTLLTAGSTVGRICEALTTSPVLKDNATGISVALSSLKLGGVGFFQSNAESNDGTMQTYVANYSESGMQSVSFPNIGSEGASASITLDHLGKSPIDNFIGENVPTETNVIVGPAEDVICGAKKNAFDGAVRFGGTFLRVGNHFQFGAFGGHISNRVIYVTVAGGAVIVTGLALIIFRRPGHEVVDAQQRPATLVPPQGNATDDDTATYQIEINLDDYGLKEGDMLDEVVLSLQVKNAKALCAAPNNSKITPVELRLLQQLENELKNKR